MQFEKTAWRRDQCVTYLYSKCILEDELDGEEHEEVYAEDYDDTDHWTQRKQASLSHMHTAQLHTVYTLAPIILPTL